METVMSNEAVAVSSPGQVSNKLTLVPSKQRIKPTKLPMTFGKLELIIKINELPNNVETNKDNWKTLSLTVTVG
jgi:hypothetical protein